MPEPTPTFSDRLKARLGDQVRGLLTVRGETTLEVAAADWATVVRALRDDPDLRFDCLVDLCGVDYLGYGVDE